MIFQIESNSDPRGFPRDMPSIIPVSPRFLYLNGDPSGSPSDRLTKYPSPVSIIKPASNPSENPTKDPYHVSKELASANPSNILI